MATTPKTRVEVIDQVLDNLGVIIEGQPIAAELRSKVDRSLNSAMATLANLEVVYVADLGTANPPDGGEFDEELFLPLCHCIAWHLASSFNLAGDPELKVMGDINEDTLRRLGRPQRTRRMLRVDPQTRSQGFRITGNFSKGT